MIKINATVIINNVNDDIFVKLDPVWTGVQHHINLLRYMANQLEFNND